MKSMQRRFGGMMKRSADEADVGQVLTEFKAVDEMLTQVLY
jgi:amphiphysin